MKRALTTIIGLPIIVYVIKFAPISIYTATVMLAMLIGLYEYSVFTRGRSSAAVFVPAYFLATLILLSFYFVHIPLLFYIPAGTVLVLIVALFSRIDVGNALQSTAFALFGAWYMGGLMGYLVGVRMIEAGGKTGADLTMLLFVVIWATDIFAYLIGRWIGRHQLSAVSPKKTVEGAVGGFIFSLVAAYVFRLFFLQQIAVIDVLILSALVGVMGQIGDLCESLLKRSANIKDSGSFIPGHGGMLDRVDSLLFGAPTMYYYYYLVLHK
jgi:phosphatidate cytidylyltransferase